MQNGRQIDLSAQVERVKHKTTAVEVDYFPAAGDRLRGPLASGSEMTRATFSGTNQTTAHLISAAGRGVPGLRVHRDLRPGREGQGARPSRGGASHAAMAGYAILIVGAFTTLVITLGLFIVRSLSSSWGAR